MEYYQLKQAIENLTSQKEKTLQETNVAQEEFTKRRQGFDRQLAELAGQIELRKKEIIVLDDEILLESFALYKPKFKFLTSEEYKTRLDACRENQKALIKGENAVKVTGEWKVNNSQSEGRKMVNDMKKLMLRSFNNECDYCVDNVKFNNIEVNEKRIEKSFEGLNKLGRMMQASITDAYKRVRPTTVGYELVTKKRNQPKRLITLLKLGQSIL
jgi:hypothetical protein